MCMCDHSKKLKLPKCLPHITYFCWTYNKSLSCQENEIYIPLLHLYFHNPMLMLLLSCILIRISNTFGHCLQTNFIRTKERLVRLSEFFHTWKKNMKGHWSFMIREFVVLLYRFHDFTFMAQYGHYHFENKHYKASINIIFPDDC